MEDAELTRLRAELAKAKEENERLRFERLKGDCKSIDEAAYKALQDKLESLMPYVRHKEECPQDGLDAVREGR